MIWWAICAGAMEQSRIKAQRKPDKKIKAKNGERGIIIRRQGRIKQSRQTWSFVVSTDLTRDRVKVTFM
jgi:hypothetical protein